MPTTWNPNDDLQEVNPLMYKPVMSWTCTKCHHPVTGPYSICESCGYPQNQTKPPNDPINPNHYKSHPSGVEAITITEHANFNLGNAIKYIWRFSFGETQKLDDLLKAKWYLEREIARKDVKK